MIPHHMRKFYTYMLKHRYHILSWHVDSTGFQLYRTPKRIIFEIQGFDPEDPYKFERRTITWAITK